MNIWFWGLISNIEVGFVLLVVGEREIGEVKRKRGEVERDEIRRFVALDAWKSIGMYHFHIVLLFSCFVGDCVCFCWISMT